MRLSEVFTRVRRFLRDTGGDIWTDDDLIQYFNDVQRELAVAAPVLTEHFTITDHPPEWAYTYLQDWERGQVSGDLYRGGEMGEVIGKTVCHVWEAWYKASSAPTGADGARAMHPWEGFMLSPGHVLPLPLPERCDRIRMITFDEETITPTTRREISGADPWYQTASGSPQHYWKPDDFSNAIVLYPRPSSPTWTTTDGPGIGTATVAETMVVGGLPDAGDANVTIFCSRVPQAYFSTQQLIDDWPEWAIKYLECGVLYRAFAADTDGHIPSLRDYWKYRYQVGMQVLRRWRSKRLVDRKIQIGRMGSRNAGRKPWPRLPSHYPDVQVG